MPQFFSCDWGTSSFRLRHVNAETGEVIAEQRSASGVRELVANVAAGDVARREAVFADFLRSQLQLLASGDTTSLDGADLIISGMATSSIGWRELPYAGLPMALDGSSLVHAGFELKIDARAQVNVRLVSGVSSADDMMRGEETELIGVFAAGRYPQVAEDGLVLLPGTHSKHVRLQQRQVTSLQTFMTGELFEVLAAHSVLRSSVQTSDGAPGSTLLERDARDAFAAGVRESSDRGLARGLFQTRVRTVLQAATPVSNGWFLSGLLIGSEVTDVSGLEATVPILLAAAEPMSAAYQLAFETLGLEKRLVAVPPMEMALASVRGHLALRRSFGRFAVSTRAPQ